MDLTWHRVNANQEARLARIRQSDPSAQRWSFHSMVISQGFEITGDLDVDRLRDAVDAATSRHDALRTAFDWSQSPARLRLTDNRPRLEVLETADGVEVNRTVNAPFNLGSGPLARFVLVPGGKGAQLWVAVDHIVADGWSMKILLAEIGRLYEDPARELPPVGVQNQDMYRLESAFCESAPGERAKAYWTEVFGTKRPLHPLEYLGSREPDADAVEPAWWEHTTVGISGSEFAEACRAARVTPYILILIGLTRAAAERTTGDVVPVWSSVANRWTADLCTAMTFGANTIPLPIPAHRSDADIYTVLKDVKRRVLGAILHARYPVHRFTQEVLPNAWALTDPAPHLTLEVERDEAELSLAGVDVRALPQPVGPVRLGIVVWCVHDDDDVTLRMGCPPGYIDREELNSLLSATASGCAAIVAEILRTDRGGEGSNPP